MVKSYPLLKPLTDQLMKELGIKPQHIDDTIVMSFLIDEVPVSNGGSTGRTLRCVKYATE